MKKKIRMTIVCSILAFGVCFSAARHAEAAQEITEQGLTLEEYISLHNLI